MERDDVYEMLSARFTIKIRSFIQASFFFIIITIIIYNRGFPLF